jgi:Tol biopolymer transport system component
MRTRVVPLFVLALGLLAAPGATALERQVPSSLVFERNGDLYRMTIDGSETVRLTATKPQEVSPAVSTDGLRIAFIRDRDELWLMNAQGRDQRRLLTRRPPSVRYASTGSPSWSPDVTFIVFDRVSQTPNEICGSIFRVRANGGAPNRLTAGVVKGWLDTDPDLSPDASRIALVSGECAPGCCPGLAVVTARGRPTQDLRQLRNTPGVHRDPAWAPDGRRLAFVVYDVDGTGKSAVYVVGRDGSGLRRLTPWAFDTGDPDWSPDGRWIAFHGPSGISLVRPDGNGLRHLLGTRAKDSSPVWLPRS